MIGRPLVDQSFVARRIGEKDPTRATAFGLSHRGKFRAPTVKAAEVTDDGVAKRAARAPGAAHAVEIDFVKDHRVGRDQFLAFQTVDEEVRRFGEVQLCELGADRVQPFDRADIVVLVVADENLLGNPLDGLGVEGQRLGFIHHRFASRLLSALGKGWLLDQGCGSGSAREKSRALQNVAAVQVIVQVTIHVIIGHAGFPWV